MGSATGSSKVMEQQRYAAALRSLRLRRWVVWGLLFACIAVGKISGWSKDLPRYTLEMTLALTVGALLWSAAFRCPRCLKFFRWGRTKFNPLTSKCVHCQLPVGAKPD
ncbi:MAG: hypothetical protein PSV46_24490 [Reyranella sp.]|nr:hypothetical protein [Reyranella sp.]